MKKILIVLLSLFFSSTLHAATYYVDKDSVGGACNNSNAGTVISSPWCTIAKANTTLTAGDTAYLRTGTYAEQIVPTNNGTSGNPITYAKYASETVSITVGGASQANLAGKSYITLDGLRFINAAGYWIVLDNGGNHCVIQNCYLSGAKAWGGINMVLNANYNKILNNAFASGNCTVTYASQVSPNTGWIYASSDAAEGASCCPCDMIYSEHSSYNLIQGNTFQNASHNAIDFENSGTNGFNIFRGNDIANHWHTGFAIYTQKNATKNLIESNIIHDSGLTAETEQPFYLWRNSSVRTQAAAFESGGGAYNQIVRKNVLYNNGTNLIIAYDANSVTKYNKWYNNTIHGEYVNFGFDCTYECSGNIAKNNSISPAASYTHLAVQAYLTGGWVNYLLNNNINSTSNYYKGVSGSPATIASSYPSEWVGNLNANPLYTNPTEHDFTLQSGSPNRDAGGWLTTITSASGSGTTFVVADSGYFFDGWGITGEVGDTIQLQGQTATAVITSINYTTHAITVNASLTWTQGLGIALAYSGTAPDIGAYEYGAGSTVAMPTMSPDGGTSASPFSVTLACSTSGADIYYTVDGTIPTSGSTYYTGAITVSTTSTLKAIGIKSGSTDSSVASAVFTVIASGQSPYGGTAWAIPGTIWPYNYDYGGAEVAYHDTTAGNEGASYRADDVDIWGIPPSLTATIDFATDEWLEYTLNVAASGSYDLALRVGTPYASRTAHVDIDGSNVSGTINIPNTGAFWTLQDVVTSINITSGTRVLRITADGGAGGDFNLYKIVLEDPGVFVAPANAPTNFTIIKGL